MESAAAVVAEHAKQSVNNVAESAADFVESTTDTAQSADDGINTNASGSDSDDPQADGSDSNAAGSALSLAERKKKLDALRSRMRDSTRQNRAALLDESTKQKTTVRETARREKQLRLAETLRLKAEAEERGEDLDRKKNWEWTIEENEEWEKKKRRKERNADFEFHDEEQQARRRYKKDLVHLKPDLASYNKQKELAMGLAPGSSSGASSSSNALTAFDPQGGTITSYEQQRAAEALYRDANTLLYADNKPSEEAIDKVVEKLNMEQDKRNKFSRKRLNEDEGDITYINERNRVFNKKIARYYDKYTAEIRASFERGTAL